MSTEAHLGPLVAIIRTIAREEALRVLVPTATHYSTETRELYPPGRYSADPAKARRQARDRIARHPAHERIGTGKATVWRVSVEAYHAKPTPTPRVCALGAQTTDEEIAARALGAAQLRPTRRAS